MKTNQNTVNFACETLQSNPASATMEVSPNPAVEPENRPRAATLKPLVYRVDEIAQLLAISPRAAYNLCNTTKDFRVVRIGTSIRVNRQSFDAWFAAL
ncbi:helix-turn-helix domain-containing protein [Faecalibacterium sp. An121]|uniref:helix-turn-helix domain-containing protein n=1 Tax=Faecalibacterium sp. An121 TaxID=1965550 RepID=UPI001FA82171|nr:helix-turn-helix domain-containing protein [Faecalibacterium sp. An121]